MTSEISSPIISPISSLAFSPVVSPLNPELYETLVRQFGDIHITNQGEEQRVQYSPDPQHPGKLKTKPLQRGEQYAFDCPFCGDDWHRLYISYQYGQPDPVTHRQNDNLWFCQNEKCHENAANRMTLRNRLINRFPRQTNHPSRKVPAVQATTRPVPPTPRGSRANGNRSTSSLPRRNSTATSSSNRLISTSIGMACSFTTTRHHWGR